MFQLPFGRDQSFDLEPVVANGKSYAVDAVLTKGRTASASLKDGRIQIRIPQYARTSEAQRLFSNLKGRIAKALERHPERFEKHGLSFANGQVLNILGKEFLIVVGGGDLRRSSVTMYEDRIVVGMRAGVDPAMRKAAVTRLVTRALRRRYTQPVALRVSELNAALGVSINRVVLKDMHSRWGSYSGKSVNISLSIKLLFAPQDVLDYVIVHELCHGRYRSHGMKFWSLVSKMMPQYKLARRWLRLNGDMLGRAGAQRAMQLGQPAL